jgi:hypothetical protein
MLDIESRASRTLTGGRGDVHADVCWKGGKTATPFSQEQQQHRKGGY